MSSFKRKLISCVALCITAILGIAVCGCDDLGAYENTEEYYDSFDKIIFIGGEAGDGEGYSVEKYFYNENSRDDFLEGEDRVTPDEYMYVAVPFTKDIKMDSFAMYLQATRIVTVYMNVYLIDSDDLPKRLEKTDPLGEEEQGYSEPASESKIGEITVHLEGGEWDSFLLDYFEINNNNEKSIYVEAGQCILLQIRNNSGNPELNIENGIKLDRAEITMTNLLVRALEIENNTEAKEEEE